MGKRYKEEDIISMFSNALTGHRIDTLYREEFINYIGITSDTNELYTEVVAELLLEHIEEFNNIKTITREHTYKTPSHNGTAPTPESNREEERIALSMFNKEYGYIGKIIDYQVPLKDKRQDDAGKIDLLSFDSNKKELILLELKGPENTETLLRTVLEIITYWHIVDKKKLCCDFGYPENTAIRKAVLVFSGGAQHNEYEQNPNTRKLMKKLDVGIYLIENLYRMQINEL